MCGHRWDRGDVERLDLHSMSPLAPGPRLHGAVDLVVRHLWGPAWSRPLGAVSLLPWALVQLSWVGWQLGTWAGQPWGRGGGGS